MEEEEEEEEKMKHGNLSVDLHEKRLGPSDFEIELLFLLSLSLSLWLSALSLSLCVGYSYPSFPLCSVRSGPRLNHFGLRLLPLLPLLLFSFLLVPYCCAYCSRSSFVCVCVCVRRLSLFIAHRAPFHTMKLSTLKYLYLT